MSEHERESKEDLERCLGLLSEAQSDEDFDAAAEMLLELGMRALPLLRRRVEGLSLLGQQGCIRLARQLGGREGAQLLTQVLEHGHEEVESECLRALGACDSEHALRPLLSWLASSADEEQHELVMEALSSLSSRLERSALRETLAGLEEGLLNECLSGAPLGEPLQRLLATERERRRLLPFGRVLEAGDEDLGRAYGREEVTRAMLERLAARGSRSVLLVGPAGSGKSSVIHDLARHLGSTAAADLLLQTSTGLLLAGTRYLGEWQTRARDLLELVSRNPRIVVYFTDVANLLSAGASSSSTDNLADVLAPAMARGELAIIGEATPETVQRVMESKPEFRRLFQTVLLDEPLPEKTRAIALEVARELAGQANARFGVLARFSESFIQRLLDLSEQFRSTTSQPGRSLDLLRSTFNRRLRETPAGESLLLEAHDLVESLTIETGVPAALLDDRASLELEAVSEFLSSRVIGQQQAISELVDLVTLIKAGLTDPSKPTGVLFFVGPTGVGKTELAKALAEFLFGSSERMIRLDMSEFNDASSTERLLGSPHAPEWSASRHGVLAGRIRHEPMSVLLLDEVEKAHRSVFDLMLQLMDDGRLTDVSGNVANFTQAIVIMTSNVGGEELFARGIGFRSENAGFADDAQRRELERVFRPEFLNRIDRVVPFRPLDEEAMRLIARREVDKLVTRSGFVRRRVSIDIDESVIGMLVRDGFDPRYGARPLKRLVERRVLLPLGRALVELGPLAEQALLRIAFEGPPTAAEGTHPRALPQDGQLARGRCPEASDCRSNAVQEAGAPQGFALLPRVEVVQREQQPTGTVATAVASTVDRGFERLLLWQSQLDADFRALEQLTIRRGLFERKASLVREMGSATFWDEPLAARRSMSEIHWIERLLAGIERLRKRVADLGQLLQQQGVRGEERSVRALGRAEDIATELCQLRMATQCNDDASRRDAFVVLNRLDTSTFEPDPLAALAGAYLNWGQRHQYRCLVVDEVLEEGILRALTLRVEGLCPFGILRHEAGIHRFHADDEAKRGREPRRERSTAYLRIDVLPFVEAELLRLNKSDYLLSRLGLSKEAKLLTAVRHCVQLSHRESDVRVRICGEGSFEDCAELGVELLRARLARFRIGHGAPNLSSTPVRSYRFGVRPSVRDDLTGVRSGRLEEVLGGRIEAFLEARVLRG